MKFIFLIFLLALSFFVRAQDTLYRADGSKLIVKVTEISKNELRYKDYSNPDGPVYIVNKNEISKVVYQNGSSETFSDISIGKRGNSGERGQEYGRHFISLNLFDLIFNSATVAYEYTLSPELGIKVPISIGTNLNREILYNDWGYYSGSKIFSTGISFNFYPREIKKVAYYIGPS